jgi:hypothetical protein
MGKAINSVPLLTREWRVEGYIWLLRGCTRDAAAGLPNWARYVGGALGDGILAATENADVVWPAGVQAQPWKLQTHNDAGGVIPFATLDGTGIYAHLESFRMSFEETEERAVVQWCTFFCGQTTGQEKLCAE